MIYTLNANPAGAAAVIDDDFATSISGLWNQHTGTWAIDTAKVKVSALSGGQALLLADADLDTVNYSVEVTFPTGSSTNKAGLIFAHDGHSSYYAVVLDRNAGKLALHKITSGSWGGALDSANATINDDTAYTVKVVRKQGDLQAAVGSVSISYSASSDLGTGQSGLYPDKSDVKFDP